MNFPSELFPDYYSNVRDFFALHLKEFDNESGYDKETLDKLKYYYHYPPDSNLDSISWFWVINSVAMRVAPVLKHIQTSNSTPVRILDAGCGLGGYSIFFAHFGPDVDGIDLNTERLSIADKRLLFFAEHGFLSGTVSFHSASIFTYLQKLDMKFDVIWVNDAISHIDPPADFLGLAYRTLKRRGIIVISDSNVLNPLNVKYMWSEQRGHSRTQRLDPSTGQMTSYSIERFFSVHGISALLRKTSFQVTEVIFHSLIPPVFRNTKLAPWFVRIDRVARKVPFLQHLVGSYTIVGTKT